MADIFQILLRTPIFLWNLITAVEVTTNYLGLMGRILRLQKFLILHLEEIYLSLLLFVNLQQLEFIYKLIWVFWLK